MSGGHLSGCCTCKGSLEIGVSCTWAERKEVTLSQIVGPRSLWGGVAWVSGKELSRSRACDYLKEFDTNLNPIQSASEVSLHIQHGKLETAEQCSARTPSPNLTKSMKIRHIDTSPEFFDVYLHLHGYIGRARACQWLGCQYDGQAIPRKNMQQFVRD